MKNNLYNTLPEMKEFDDVYCKTYKCFYHASLDKIPDDLIMVPRVPNSYLACEDSYIPRISLSRSIEGALKGTRSKWDYHFTKKSMYIYKIFYDETLKVVEPTMRAVPDGYLIDELWCLSEIHPSHRQLVGIATNINMLNNDVDNINNVIFNDTVIFDNYYNKRRSMIDYGEIYFDYIPAKIIKSPFIKINKNKEYEKYLINEKNIDDINNPNPFNSYKKEYKVTEAGLNYYKSAYDDYIDKIVGEF